MKMAAFPIHNLIHVDEDAGQLNATDAAACNRVLELFSTPYPDLTQAQVLMLEKIRDAANSAQTPFRHVFLNEPNDEMPLANRLHLNGSSEFHPLRNIAPYLKTTKSQHETGHTNPDTIADQFRAIWKTFCVGREDGANYIYTQHDVLEFVEWCNTLVEDPTLGIPLVSRRGGHHHIKYDNDQQCFFRFGQKSRIYRLCLTPGCLRSEQHIISDQFQHCMQHYNNAVHVVMEISRSETPPHPYRHVKFQVTINNEWNNYKLREYFQNIWMYRRPAYKPLVVDSYVTQVWIFENYQLAIDKVSSLQFCHLL